MASDNSQITVQPKLSHNTVYAWSKLSVKQKVECVPPLDPTSPVPADCVRFVCISDTHNKVECDPGLVPPGDVLLHAGDFTMTGTPAQIDKFNHFLGTLPHKVKVVVAGNHDMTLDENKVRNSRDELCDNFNITDTKYEKYIQDHSVSSSKELLTNCVYLEDSSVDICGIKVYGAPWVPEFCFMGFNIARGQPILDKWNLIPSDTDIVITHGPPLGRGDLCLTNDRAGCLELLNTIQQRVKPKYHVYGHIHEGYGLTTDGITTFINASMCTLRYRPTNPAIVIDVPVPEGHSKEELSAVFTPTSHRT
ncbi:metallophosphoesterase domain-containing protein 1-like [Haliotis rufescens]|uniref:metallophosphoesterase domain-containing protein 1-like n=1 Tax=Haliotis rufescens TaxID=6454 RepID=UPI00201F50A8|nr:metallophosphoesterase domain-containing protein 1-like [Haliotis rufescens]